LVRLCTWGNEKMLKTKRRQSLPAILFKFWVSTREKFHYFVHACANNRRLSTLCINSIIKVILFGVNLLRILVCLSSSYIVSLFVKGQYRQSKQTNEGKFTITTQDITGTIKHKTKKKRRQKRQLFA
jgi:hypothetical protein